MLENKITPLCTIQKLFFMRKEEISEFIEESFKKIAKHFRKAIHDFEMEDISQFRVEIKKLKVFLHLLNMESNDGFSFRITKRMKTIYGYFGIIQNLEQLKKTNKSVNDLPAFHPNMLEREIEYWKILSKDFIDSNYNFIGDKKEILATLPDKLTKKSIHKFIHYTLYELSLISNRLDDVALHNFRKFMEDIYYNYVWIKLYLTEQQTNLFNENEVRQCLDLFNNYRDECMTLALLETLTASELDDKGKRILKKIENDRLLEKKEIKNQLSIKLSSMHLTANNLNEFALGYIN
jgi:CHAD domain-containing protein